MERDRCGEARDVEVLRVGLQVGEVEPSRHVSGRAVSAAGAERGVKNVVFSRNVDGPAAEDVGDYAGWRVAVLRDHAGD